MDAAQLRPLGVGEILDLAIKIYRERFAHLLRAVAVVVAPVSVFGALVQLSLPDAEEAVSTELTDTGQPVIDAGDFWTLMAGLLLVGLVSYAASQLAAAASFKLVSGAYLDEEPDWRRSLAFARSKLAPLVWLTIVFVVLLGLAFLALIVPAVYLYGAWAVAVPVLLFEDVRGRGALKRSRELVRGRWWPVMGALVVALILSSVAQGVFSALLLAVVSAGSNDVVDAAAQAIANTAASVVTTPFTAAVITVVYFDLRVRKEGFDLELLAGRVGIEPEPGPALRPPDDQPPYRPPPPAGPPDG